MPKVIRSTTKRLYIASDPAADGATPLTIGQVVAWVDTLKAEKVADDVPLQYEFPDGRLTLFVEVIETVS